MKRPSGNAVIFLISLVILSWWGLSSGLLDRPRMPWEPKVEQRAGKIAKLDCVVRTSLGQQEIINPELTPEERTILAIAVGVAIDREGETPECQEDVDIGLIDAYIRLNAASPQTPAEDVTTTSRIWLPDSWEYPWYWKDRPICWVRSGREATVERLKPIVKERLKTGPAQGCGDRVKRATMHLGGRLGGERKAQAEVLKYRQDSEWKKKQGNRKCLTDFRCSR